MRILWLLAFIWAFASPALASTPALSFTDKYDEQIKEGVWRYWPDFPFWKAWKAQLYQESRLNPDAISPVGARGLAQFMPATWAEVSQELSYGMVSSHIAKYAIEAGAYYMAKQRRFWRSTNDPDRQQLAQASYNAGAGNIRKAQHLCNNRLYEGIISCLPSVTGRHAQETIIYVKRILRYWHILEAQK